MMPEMAVLPVTVLVTVPLVNTEVRALVVTAVALPVSLDPALDAAPEPEAVETVETKVVTKVEPSLVTVETTYEVTGLAAAPEALWLWVQMSMLNSNRS